MGWLKSALLFLSLALLAAALGFLVGGPLGCVLATAGYGLGSLSGTPVERFITALVMWVVFLGGAYVFGTRLLLMCLLPAGMVFSTAFTALRRHD